MFYWKLNWLICDNLCGNLEYRIRSNWSAFLQFSSPFSKNICLFLALSNSLHYVYTSKPRFYGNQILCSQKTFDPSFSKFRLFTHMLIVYVCVRVMRLERHNREKSRMSRPIKSHEHWTFVKMYSLWEKMSFFTSYG